jgi:hypothetical protein
MFTPRNGSLGSISSTIEFTSSRPLTKSGFTKISRYTHQLTREIYRRRAGEY